jgi:IclR family transcriptional regulator, KDG regulon repressor
VSAQAMRTNVGRRLEILSAVLHHEARTGEGLGVVAVSEAIGREKTQISRGLRHLAEAALVERDGVSREFLAGAELLTLASRAGDTELLRAAPRTLERLAADSGERSHLSVLSGGEVLTIDTVAATSGVQAVGWVGRTTPAHCTAAGAALLVDHGPGELRELLGDRPLPPAGPGGPRTLEELARRLEEVARRQIAVSDGEFQEGLMAVAAPVRGSAGQVVAAIHVAGPDFRLRPRVGSVLGAVAAAAGRLRAAIASDEQEESE